MKLLVYANVYAPDHAGGAAVFTDFCEAAAAAGHDVTVRTAFPYYPEWRDKSGANGWRRVVEHRNGVRIERHGLYIPRTRTMTERMVYELSLIASMARGLFAPARYDCVVAFATMFATAASAAAYATVRRTPLVVSVQDISSLAAKAAGYSSGGALQKLLGSVERLALRRADRVVTIAPGMATVLEEELDRRVEVVPNWANASLVEAASETATLDRPDLAAPRLLYAGNIGRKQGLVELCEALRSSPVPFSFTIHGSGPGAAEVEAWIAAAADDRFRLGPFLPEADFVAALAAADLFVISEVPGAGNAFMPSKLVAAVVVGTPVLAVCDPAGSLGREVAEHDLGPVVTWDRVSSADWLGFDAEQWHAWAAACAQRRPNYLAETGVGRLLALAGEASQSR